ncbi:MAG: glutamate 5-kinase [Spirochaetota bacterium]
MGTLGDAASPGDSARDFSGVRRLVVKVGTNVLVRDGMVDVSFVGDICRQLVQVRNAGHEVLVVTSGAIGMGAVELGVAHKLSSIRTRQACAALGQPLLMEAYRDAFRGEGVKVAQVLVTREVFENRTSYVNLRNAVEALLELGVVPIFNENDSVSTEEIGSAFGDNDRLSAMVASKVDADLLCLLTDIDALYDDDPRHNPAAKPIRRVTEITDEIVASAGAPGSPLATGGMKTKIEAVRIARRGGCRVVLAHGRETSIVPRILAGEAVGTLFDAQPRLGNRMRWIMNAEPKGRILVDQGAFDAVHRRKSLLPKGLVGVEGNFAAGSVVELVCPGCTEEAAKLVTALDSSDLRRVMGRHSSEVSGQIGEGKKEIIARPEDIVFLEESVES